MNDPHDLQRFVDAQAHTYDQALAELRAGQKRTHWMWFVLPADRRARAAAGWRSGSRSTAWPRRRRTCPIRSLGRRLVEAAKALTALDTEDPAEVFGSVDAMKLHSSMTLFAQADPDEPVFREVLDHYFGGTLDEETTSRL